MVRSLVSLSVATLLLLFAAPLASEARACVTSIERGTPLRSVLLDAARPTFETATAGPVIFIVNRLATCGDWAFANVDVRRPKGGSIDWTKTPHADDFNAGMFDAGAHFVLLKRADSTWSVKDVAIGPTDVTWDGWRAHYGLPLALFHQP